MNTQLPSAAVRLRFAFLLIASIATLAAPAQTAVTEAWVRRYSLVVNNADDRASKIGRDAAGNIIVAGSTDDSSSSNQDMLTLKYSGADGSVFWQQRYNGPANGDDYPMALAVDGSGNVVVTGASSGTNRYDYYTAKYAAADGALLWEQRHTAQTNHWDEARAVAVDGGGNVVVTGQAANSFILDDYYTAKYAAADGALLWEKYYNGPANNLDRAIAVAVDGSSNVVVTGFSSATNSYDCYTAKYASADGALLWEKQYNGPANGIDIATSLALGPNGIVAVTGYSYELNNRPDYSTIVYWERLPALSIALVLEGVRIRFSGVPGHRYTIERAPAVTGPWTTLSTATAPTGGVIEFTTPLVGTAFYRTAQPQISPL